MSEQKNGNPVKTGWIRPEIDLRKRQLLGGCEFATNFRFQILNHFSNIVIFLDKSNTPY
jgi:hypothetical protein